VITSGCRGSATWASARTAVEKPGWAGLFEMLKAKKAKQQIRQLIMCGIVVSLANTNWRPSLVEALKRWNTACYDSCRYRHG